MDIEQWRAYLRSKIDPSEDAVSFTRLEGGYLNSTIRVILNRDIIGIGDIPDLTQGGTLILKHYPPYMYAWPDASLSTTRAKAEVDALGMMHSDPHLANALKVMNATVPRILHFEEGQKVLWMEDLGEQKTLEDYLQPEYKELGSRIGSIMAAIHLSTLPLPKTIPTEPPAGPHAVLEHDQRMLRLIADQMDARELLDRLRMRDSPIIGLPHRDAPMDEICLGLGDVWPTSFLVMGDNLKLGIIDWEFFGPMHPASEIATLVARLYVAYVQKGLDPSNAMPVTMVEAYMDAFRQSSHTELLGRSSWTRRARAAWARVLLNQVYRAKTEGGEGSRTKATDVLLQEAIQSLRGEDANPLLSRLCNGLDYDRHQG